MILEHVLTGCKFIDDRIVLIVQIRITKENSRNDLDDSNSVHTTNHKVACTIKFPTLISHSPHSGLKFILGEFSSCLLKQL